MNILEKRLLLSLGVAYKIRRRMNEEKVYSNRFRSYVINKNIAKNFYNSIVEFLIILGWELKLNGNRFIVQNLETVKNTESRSTEYAFSKQKMSSIYGSWI
jgi:hypothetical protein